MVRYQRLGMIARWRPVHRGHVAVLRALCDSAAEALIGIGSANRYNLRNPFTLEETTDMLRLALAGRGGSEAADRNYRLLPVPDLDDGPRWRAMVIEMFGPLEAFVTDNPYVASLLREDYRLLKPVALIAEADRVAIDGTMVRAAMARGGEWQRLVPPEIAEYLISRGLDERFRREFGLQTLALETIVAAPGRAAE